MKKFMLLCKECGSTNIKLESTYSIEIDTKWVATCADCDNNEEQTE